jgi:glycosyltransferase involved in cell wall biosynthesis
MPHPISVAVYLPSLEGGGAERVALNLAIALFQQGFQVDLVVQNAIGPYLAQVPAGLGLVDLQVSGPRSNLQSLARYLKRRRPDVLLAILDNWNVAGLAKRLAGVPTRIIASAHNLPSIDLNLGPNWKSRIKLGLMRLAYGGVDDFVAVSQGVAAEVETILGLPKARIRVIYNPLVTPALAALAQAPLTDSRSQTSGHPWLAADLDPDFDLKLPPVILGVGRLTAQKDFPTLIRAFALVRQQRPARLMILGEGPLRPELTALIESLGLGDEVDLVGFQDNPYAYLARSAVFAFSSAWEGFGNVIVEALAVGTPVVSTDCRSGPAEILGHNGEYGRLVPVGDAPALAAAILAVLAAPPDPGPGQRRSADFTIAAIVAQYRELFEGRD